MDIRDLENPDDLSIEGGTLYIRQINHPVDEVYRLEGFTTPQEKSTAIIRKLIEYMDRRRVRQANIRWEFVEFSRVH